MYTQGSIETLHHPNNIHFLIESNFQENTIWIFTLTPVELIAMSIYI